MDLCEWDYGKYEGLSTDEIRHHEPDFSTWTTPITGGESLQQVGERADRVLQRATEPGGRSLLFAHGHLLRILAAHWVLGWSLPVSGFLPWRRLRCRCWGMSMKTVLFRFGI